MTKFSCLDVAEAAGLDAGKASGAERYFRCPCHDDARPSLAVNEGRDVWLCGPCGASGTAWQLAAHLAGLDPGDKPTVTAWLVDRGLLNGNGKAPTHSWEVRDADGRLVAVHHRRDTPEGKRLWWARPGGANGLGGLKVADLPLYGTEHLAEREPGDDSPTFLVEGEKATDALLGLGLSAVGTVTGAATAPGEDALRALDGRDVVAWPDADPAGRAHLRSVAARLGNARIWEPADAPKGADAADWVVARAGADRDDVVAGLLATVEREAVAAENAPEAAPTEEAALGVEDFFAYMPQHSYIFVPSREMWPAASVNARVADPAPKTKAAAWLDEHRAVEQMTWAPGEPLLIEGRLIAEGGWIDRAGVSCFNLYRPPAIVPGDAAAATPWLDHIVATYPDDADHLVAWLAHRVQRPAEKVNHALLIGGAQGIGKDTVLEPVKHAVGPWNFQEVGPSHLLGRFNGFVKSVILRVSEARDLGDMNRYQFYEHLKAYAAAPPDVLRVDEKHAREYAVPNVLGVIITTNHKTAGIYLPADDRRHYVAWSSVTRDAFSKSYWQDLWGWYARGGVQHVAAYLAEHDLGGFDPKAPPPKTAAFWDIVDANRAPEDAELADALDLMGDPDAVILDDVAAVASEDFAEWLRDRRNARQVPHRLEEVGYVPVRNDAAKDGRWKIGGVRRSAYAKESLTPRDRIAAVRDLAEAQR